MLTYSEEEIQKYFEQTKKKTDPFQNILSTESGKSKLVKFIKAARATRSLNDAAIQAGLLVIENDTRGDWSIQDIIDQIIGGVYIDEDTWEKYVHSKKPLTKAQVKSYGNKIYKSFKEGELKLREAVRIVKRIATPQLSHELTKTNLSAIKKLIKAGFEVINAVNERGAYKGDISGNFIDEVILNIIKELKKINQDFEIEGLKNLISKLDEVIKKKISWEAPDEPIEKKSDIDKYFRQLETSRPKQETRIKQYKKKLPKVIKEKAKKAEDMQAENKIKSKAEELARSELKGYAVVDRPEAMKVLNKAAEELAKQKLATGQTIESYIRKQGHKDDISEIVVRLIKHIKERRGKEKI